MRAEDREKKVERYNKYDPKAIYKGREYYDKLKNSDPYSSVMIDLERFAHKIIDLCAAQCEPKPGLKYSPNTESAMEHCRADILALKE
jgi:hypothetical protein